jgi:hypothetical protein
MAEDPGGKMPMETYGVLPVRMLMEGRIGINKPLAAAIRMSIQEDVVDE